MRQLALAQSEPALNDVSTYGTSYSKHRQDSGSSRKADSSSSIFSGLSIPSSATTPSLGAFGSDGWTTASSHDSRSLVELSPSLLSKRRASANASDAYDNSMLSTRLASLPLPLSPFGTVRLMESHARSKEQDALTPRPFPDAEDVMTPGTAAAATWTETQTPGYFAPTHTPQPKTHTAKHVAKPEACFEDEQAFGLESKSVGSPFHESALPNSYALRRSAQSLALGLRFKMMKAGRKLKRTSQGAFDHFSPGDSNELSVNTPALAAVHP